MINFFSLQARNDQYAALIQQATLEVLQESRFINGSHVERFEFDFANYLQVKHVVGVANGLDALTIALLALEIGKGDEVIVPGFTFIATWLAVSRVGATIVPADVDLNSANIGVTEILGKITTRTKAVIAVNLFGRPALTPDVVSEIQALGIRVIEDSAQSHGVAIGELRSGTNADVSCYSFYPTKNLGALGDGGAISTNDSEISRKARAFSNYGAGESKYDHIFQGLNSRLDSLQAAYLLLFLPSLDHWNVQRQEIAHSYRLGINNQKIQLLSGEIPISESVWHHFVVRVKNRQNFIDWAYRQGLELAIHYPIIPLDNPAYSELRKNSDLKLHNSRILAREVCSLPIYPQLSSKEQKSIIDIINKY